MVQKESEIKPVGNWLTKENGVIIFIDNEW